MRASILLGLLLGIPFAGAQTTSQAIAPDGSIRTHIEGIDVPPVANAPFTAKVVVAWDEPLIGGGTISRTYYTLVARDSQGRVHREIRDFVPAGSSAEPRLRSFTITDPTSGTTTKCTPNTMNCTATEFHPSVALTQEGGAAVPATANIRRASLGEQTIDSMPVVGTRETVTTFAGTHGNDRVIVSHRDLWYSPDLQMNLSVVRSNPQLGQLTLTVTDLVREEPASEWFAIPSGYAVSDARTQ